MKKANYLLSAVVAFVAFYATASVRADEPLLSPRARANQIQVVSSPAVKDPNLLTNRPAGNAKAWALLQSVRTVPSTGSKIDLAHAHPALSPKDPRYEAAVREIAVSHFQVAPLK